MWTLLFLRQNRSLLIISNYDSQSEKKRLSLFPFALSRLVVVSSFAKQIDECLFGRIRENSSSEESYPYRPRRRFGRAWHNIQLSGSTARAGEKKFAVRERFPTDLPSLPLFSNACLNLPPRRAPRSRTNESFSSTHSRAPRKLRLRTYTHEFRNFRI